MTTTEIRLKCLELAIAKSYGQPNADNYVILAKIYENYLLGITEQTVEEKKELLPSYKKLTNKELLESVLDSFTQRLSDTCKHH